MVLLLQFGMGNTGSSHGSYGILKEYMHSVLLTRYPMSSHF